MSDTKGASSASGRRQKAEAFLQGDARVASYTLAEVGGGLDVAAVPAEPWLARERATAHASLSSRIVRQWQMVYDRSYRWDGTVRPPNFDAWVSGFTGEAIPIAAMQAWLDDALAQMRSVPHSRVLEIGCGVGLVLATLAPGGVAYDGIDLSAEAIASLGAWVATQSALRHARLVQRAAHELDGLDAAAFDLAVMNSVVQYFPDAGYLLRVLALAADRMVAGGSIFLGDLRAAALLPMRAICIAAARAPATAKVGDVRADAAAVLGLARELAIDPGFFAALGARLPRMGAVRFSLKPPTADRELSSYRYDAMLMLDARPDPQASRMTAEALEEIVARLESERPEAIAVSGLANARLASDVALARAVEGADAKDSMARVANSLRVAAAIEPSVLAEAATARGYTVEMRFTPGSADGCFDALFRRSGVRARWPDAPSAAAPLANDPLGDELAGKLRRDLQASLDAALGGRGLARLALATPSGLPAGGEEPLP